MGGRWLDHAGQHEEEATRTAATRFFFFFFFFREGIFRLILLLFHQLPVEGAWEGRLSQQPVCDIYLSGPGETRILDIGMPCS
jgi:hypothetical protein